MRKHDGKDPVNSILHIEQYFDLHDVQLLQKVYIESYIYSQIILYGIEGFVLVNHLSPSQFSRRK